MTGASTATDIRLRAPDWRLAAVVALSGSPLLLFRSEPLHWAWPALGLLLLPLLRRGRGGWLVGLGLLAWMALIYQQTWEQRLSAAEERTLVGLVEAPVQSTGDGLRFSFQPDGPAVGRLRVSWYAAQDRPRAGECWELQLRLRPPRGSANPGGPDYEAWLFREAYAGRASVRQGRPCGPTGSSRPESPTQRWRSHGPARAVASLNALLLGDRSGMSDADWTVLRRTGTSHLFAISGLHLGLVAGAAWGLGVLLWRALLWRWLPRARDPAALLAAAAAVSYAAISGFGVPVQRALIMCLLGLLLIVGGRERPALALLGLAAVLVVGLNPMVLLGPGFWLSFSAVLAIILYLKRWPQQPRWRRLLGLQLWLSLFLLPLVWFCFGGVAWLSVPVNLLLVPLFGLLLPALMLGAAADVLLDWSDPLRVLLLLLELLWRMLDAVAAPAWSYTSLAQPGLSATVLAMAGLAWLVLGRGRRRAAGLLCLLPLLGAGEGRPAPGELRVWFWDVGQGQSVLLQTAHRDLLYDAGPAWPGGFDAGARLVVPALRSIGVRRLDRLIISHPDSDHAGGAAAVREAFGLGAAPPPCIAGEAWDWDGVHFELLHPEPGDWSDNDGSCVLLVRTAAGRSLLLTGDIQRAGEAALLRVPERLRVDLISVPHHGSSSSSSAEFLAAVSPRWAVVSSGWGNRWGFPRPDVMARYAERKVQVLQTAEQGALRFDMGAQLSWSAHRVTSRRLWREMPAPP